MRVTGRASMQTVTELLRISGLAESMPGGSLTLRDYDGHVAEALTMVHPLNKMTKAVMPESVRIAWQYQSAEEMLIPDLIYSKKL